MSEDTRKVNERLISFVKSRPALYDLRVSPKQRTKIIKENIWKDISERLEGQLDPEAAEARWKYLRENYIKSRRKEKLKDEIAKRSGVKESARKGKYSFRYHEIMQFLNDALDYQKTMTRNNVSKTTKLTEIKLEKNFRSNRSKPLTVSEPEHCEVNKQKEQETNLDKDSEFEELDSEVMITSMQSNLPMQQNLTIDDDNCVNQKNGIDDVFLQCLKKPIEKPCPIDGFLVRLGEGLRRLPYRERSKLELEFLTRLHEVEEMLCDDN